jgi:putative membrane protein
MEITLERTERSFKDYLVVLFKGMCMGAADVVPGVSGGTIAFIIGVYDEWIDSLKRCTPAVLLRAKREGIPAAWKHINGWFLVALFGGMLISLKTLAGVVLYALDNYPVVVWSFFTGLIAASVYYIGSKQSGWKLGHWLAFLGGTLFVYWISILTPAQLPGHWWILFLGGFFAICALVLPGISGSFVLLLAGLYHVFLNAIHNLDFVALAWFGSGCVCGFILFSRFVSWLLHHHHNITMATLIGFLVGSLNVTWPWKQALVTTVDSHGRTIVLQQENLNPLNYMAVTGSEPLILLAIVSAIAGAALVLITEWTATKMSK